MVTFNTRNNFNGASFDYENGGCKASGEFRIVETKLFSFQINGNIAKYGQQFYFNANKHEGGQVSTSCPQEITIEAVTAVNDIIAKIEALNSAE